MRRGDLGVCGGFCLCLFWLEFGLNLGKLWVEFLGFAGVFCALFFVESVDFWGLRGIFVCVRGFLWDFG